MGVGCCQGPCLGAEVVVGGGGCGCCSRGGAATTFTAVAAGRGGRERIGGRDDCGAAAGGGSWSSRARAGRGVKTGQYAVGLARTRCRSLSTAPPWSRHRPAGPRSSPRLQVRRQARDWCLVMGPERGVMVVMAVGSVEHERCGWRSDEQQTAPTMPQYGHAGFEHSVGRATRTGVVG